MKKNYRKTNGNLFEKLQRKKIFGKISGYIARKIVGKIAREKKLGKLLDNSRKNCKRKKAGKIVEKLTGICGKIKGKIS